MTFEIYLDSNATNAVLPQAVEAARQTMAEGFGNPSSTHLSGLRARALLESVRQRAGRLLGAGNGRLMFNSGATEGIHTAVLSALMSVRERREAGRAVGSALLYGATEHKAVPESLAHWNRLLGLGLQIVALPVDGEGRHDLVRLQALAPDAALVCTMAANNETGVISDLAGIERALIACGSPALWLVDGVQALGKLPLDLASMRIDYAPFSGHKLYAPKGIGMLYVRDGAPFTPMMVGGGQEAGARSGTENMSGIAALGAVLEALDDGLTFRPHAELCGFRDRLAKSLRAALPELRFNTPFDKSLPTTLNFSVPGLASQELLNLFDAAGVRVSAGSACSSGLGAPSHVLEAMQLPVWRSGAGIRLSFGPLIEAATVAAACLAIDRCGEALRCGGRLASRARCTPRDGVMAWEHQDTCGWLLTDAASGRCIVIDPPAPLVQRIVDHVFAHDLAVLAVLGTGADLDGSEVRQQMVSRLGARLAPPAGADASDLPPLGHLTLERIDIPPGHSAYLLGAPAHGRLAADEVAFAFIGQMSAADCPGDRFHADTVLCQGGRTADLPIGVSREEPPAAEPQSAIVDAAGLDAFFSRHPTAVVVDVRDASEHAASNGLVLGGRAAISVPLASVAHHAHAWLRDGEPVLLFVCRSGPRSERAAACLRRLGRRQAWHLAGGLTHASTPTAPAMIAAS